MFTRMFLLIISALCICAFGASTNNQDGGTSDFSPYDECSVINVQDKGGFLSLFGNCLEREEIRAVKNVTEIIILTNHAGSVTFAIFMIQNNSKILKPCTSTKSYTLKRACSPNLWSAMNPQMITENEQSNHTSVKRRTPVEDDFAHFANATVKFCDFVSLMRKSDV